VATINHFAYGWITPVLAYLLSYLGSVSGLTATARARRTQDRRRRGRWLILAACAIGGTGIWAMHFMAMLGFTVDSTDVRFDLPITVASWLTAVVVVGIGLFIVGYGPRSVPRVLAAGLFTGLGVAGMHYAGMSAMRLDGSISYDHTRVVLSLVIAVVAATAALWFTVSVVRLRWIAVAAGIMGVAVVGMHYTGMSAVSVHPHATATAVPGLPALDYLIPMLLFVLLVLYTLFAAVLAPSVEDGTVAERRTVAPAGSPRAGSLWAVPPQSVPPAADRRGGGPAGTPAPGYWGAGR
jgi:NO-binding membrane sensor protein with MHYT domain